MRVFVAGAAGAIGRQLIPMLIGDGHDVTGTTRTPERVAWLEEVGAHATVVDAYDGEALRRAVVVAAPEVVVHQLTDLAGGFGQAQLAANARLRRIGTRNLVEASLAAGARRVVAQSGAWLYAPGPTPHGEADPLLDPADDPANAVLPGIIELERLVRQTPGFDGVVMRYGFLYGPGTASATATDRPAVQVSAAARAAALAAVRGPAGTYNIVDDGGDVDNRLARRILGWRPTDR